MILHCTYEELSAAAAGAKQALAVDAGSGAHVAAPPEVLADVEALLPRLSGDISVTTFAGQQSLERALGFILAQLHDLMDERILQEYVGAESSVTAFFDYAYVLTIHDRVRRMGQEMAAMIELMTGQPPTPESARAITFPD